MRLRMFSNPLPRRPGPPAGLEAAPVILDLNLHPAGRFGHAHAHLGGLRVLEHVVQGFLDHQEQIVPDLGRQHLARRAWPGISRRHLTFVPSKNWLAYWFR